MDNYQLYHWGIKGMRWGVRRYQNKDGSLTPAGRKRYEDEGGGSGSSNGGTKGSSKTLSSMSDAELRDKLARLRMERDILDTQRQISNLEPQHISAGKRFLTTVGKDVIAPSAAAAGKNLLTQFLTSKGSKMLGLQTDDALGDLKKTVESLELKKRYSEVKKYFEGDNNPLGDLKRQAEELELRKKIDVANKYFESSNKKKNSQNTNSTESKPKAESSSSSGTAKESTTVSSSSGTTNVSFRPNSFAPYTPQQKTATSKTMSTGRQTVEQLASSGYSMKSVSELSGSSVTKGASNSKAFLSQVGNWSMSRLEDLEKR